MMETVFILKCVLLFNVLKYHECSSSDIMYIGSSTSWYKAQKICRDHGRILQPEEEDNITIAPLLESMHIGDSVWVNAKVTAIKYDKGYEYLKISYIVKNLKMSTCLCDDKANAYDKARCIMPSETTWENAKTKCRENNMLLSNVTTMQQEKANIPRLERNIAAWIQSYRSGVLPNLDTEDECVAVVKNGKGLYSYHVEPCSNHHSFNCLSDTSSFAPVLTRVHFQVPARRHPVADYSLVDVNLSHNPTYKPEMPTDFIHIDESLDATSVILTWSPGYNGGLSQVFVIQYRLSSEASWTRTEIPDNSDDRMFYKLLGLQRGEGYTAQMHAFNTRARSDVSASIQFRTQHKDVQYVVNSTTTSNVIFSTPKAVTCTTSSHTGGIVGGCMAAVLVVIATVGVVILFYRRKQETLALQNTGCEPSTNMYSDLETRENLQNTYETFEAAKQKESTKEQQLFKTEHDQ